VSGIVGLPERRRIGWILSRHIFREIVAPTLFVLAGFVFVVMLRDLFGYADWLINRGIPMAEVGPIAGYRLVPVVAQTLPFAMLLGVLMALGRLASDHELLAIEASGGSGLQLVAPLLAFAGLTAAAALLLSVVGAPWAARSLDAALLRAAAANPTTTLRPGEVRNFGDWRLEAREVSPRGDTLRGVMLWAPVLGETVFAKQARVATQAGGQVQLSLDEGVIVVHLGDGRATRAQFHRMVERLQETHDETAPPGEVLDRASLEELREAHREAGSVRRARQVEATLQRRFAMPATALVFGLLALPLFLARRRPSRSAGAALGVGVGVAWFGLLQLGAGLLYIEALPVFVAVWLPAGALLLAAVGLALRMRQRTLGARSALRGARGRGGGSARLRRKVLLRYILGIFLRTALLAFAGLLAAYLLVDFLDNLQWFTKYHSTSSEVARFYAARLPLLASRVFPVALLVASSLTVSLLAAGGELIAMRACGTSNLRIVAPILVVCGVLAGGYFAVSDQVLPHTNALAQRIKRTEIKGKSHARGSAWYRSGDKLYQVALLDPLAGVAEGVVIYQLDAEGMPESRTDAPLARHIGGGVWRLIDPVRIDLGPRLSRQPAEPFADLGEELPADVEPGNLSIKELRNEIREVEAGGYNATPHRVDLQAKLASPLACLVLPAVALLFAMLGPPFPTPMRMLLVCTGVAVAHALLSAGTASLGYKGVLPPVLAGWASPALLSLVALGLALRVRGFAPTR